MAAAQEQPQLANVSNEKKVILEELLKEANNIQEEEEENARERTSTFGAIRNSLINNEDMKLVAEHLWSGSFRCGPPGFIKNATVGTFFYQGALAKGCKAAVAYRACGNYYILAWHVPVHGNNKVYVDVVPEGPIDWRAIEKKLDGINVPGPVVAPGLGPVIPPGPGPVIPPGPGPERAVAIITQGHNAKLAAAYFY